jgi:1,4-dihydroxy-2-naphthoate octaprenyltransferase
MRRMVLGAVALLFLVWAWPNLIHEPVHWLALEMQGSSGIISFDFGHVLAHPSITRTAPVQGIVGGLFYSSRPLRWVSRGWGELWIAFCYGWLPVAVGFYLQSGAIPQLIHWTAVPIGLTIFNVILLNEFPDYPADLRSGKANLTVRIGRERAAVVYALAALGSWIAVGASLTGGVPNLAGWLYIPVLALSLIVAFLVLRGTWRARDNLEKLCAANLLVNLGTTASYILAFGLW